MYFGVTSFKVKHIKKYRLLDLVYGEFIGEPANHVSRPYKLVQHEKARIFTREEAESYIIDLPWKRKIQFNKV